MSYGAGLDPAALLGDFGPVLAVLQLDELPAEAARVRDEINRPGRARTEPAELPVVGTHYQGLRNILFPLHFPDGAQWLVRIPVDGVEGKWDEFSADVHTSDVTTLRLIKDRTTIPVPRVYGFSSTLDNPLKCPHMFLSFIPGEPLSDLWYRADKSADELRSSRSGVLEQIAEAMVELDQFGSEIGGRMAFKDMEPVGVGSCIEYMEGTRIVAGPFNNSRDFYACVLDQYQPALAAPAQGDFEVGVEKLLRLFIDCVTDFEDDESPVFVLAHPDMELGNFLVSPEGDVVGIIDWDNVAFWPRSYGNRRYPGWLTRDWDPVNYGHHEATRKADAPWDDSPEALARYRKVYRTAIRKASSERRLSDLDKGATLVTENLLIAARNRLLAFDILHKIVLEIAAVVKLPSNMRAYDICLALGENRLDKKVRQALCKGFMKLLRRTSL